MSTPTQNACGLVALLGWEWFEFFDALKESSLADMEETLRILTQRCDDDYYNMLGDAAIMGIIDEAIDRATAAGEWP